MKPRTKLAEKNVQMKETHEGITTEDFENESAIICMPNNLLAIRLPLITGNPAERLVVVRWHVAEDDIVVAGQYIVRIATMYQGIELPMPPWLEGRYRIHSIEKQREEILTAGDVFVILEDLNASDINPTSSTVHSDSSCAA